MNAVNYAGLALCFYSGQEIALAFMGSDGSISGSVAIFIAAMCLTMSK